jgi:hypothetical protein
MKKTLLALLAVLGLAASAFLVYEREAVAASVLNYFSQATAAGDNVLNLSGTWKVDGTSVTATGAELNYVDVTTAGTAEGTKALVLTSSRSAANVNSFEAANLIVSDVALSASGDLTLNGIRSFMQFNITTTGGAVDIDFGEDAVLDAAMIGQRWRFLIVAGTNALTVTAGTTVSTLPTVQSGPGASCEDVGDYIDVIPYTTSAAKAWSYCAD